MSFSISSIATSIKSKLPFAGAAKNGSHLRAHSRHPCALMSQILIADKGYKLEGLLIEISRGGVRFREASSFILNRLGLDVIVLAGDLQLPGKVVNVSNNGYGIKLDALMAEGELEQLLASAAPPGLTQN